MIRHMSSSINVNQLGRNVEGRYGVLEHGGMLPKDVPILLAHIRSLLLRPLMVTNSKGPWIYVSVCVMLSHFRKGRRLWHFAYSSDVSDGRTRCVSVVSEG